MKTNDEVRRANLTTLIQEAGSPARLSNLIDRSAAQISQWKNASKDSRTGKPRGISNETARLLEDKCGKNRGWMDVEHSSSNSTTPPRPIRVWDNIDELDEGDVLIPALMLKLSAGKGEQVFEIDTKGRGRAFQRDYIDRLGIKPGCAATMSVSGNSMGPRIEDGDSVLVDYCRQTILDGKVYAFVWQDEYFIKRVFKEVGGGLRLVSDNQDKNQHPDRMIPPDHIEEFRLIGQVVGLAGGKI